MVKLKIEKLVEGGQGIGYSDDPAYARHAFFVWETLPGEEVEAEITKKRKGIFEARAINILKRTPQRIEPLENHYLSCSPWQIMDGKYENEQKVSIAIEDYRRIAKLSEKNIETLDIKIFSNDKLFSYRNKMEFSFIEKENHTISLAFFKRGQNKKIAIDGCELATTAINETAKKILAWINENKLTERNLKTLIIRSNKKGETIAGLFIKDKLDLCRGKACLALDDKFVGFSLYYSTHKSPASVITEVLYQEGQDFLFESISVGNGHVRSFKYGINSFFQVNIPVFEMALKDIVASVGSIGGSTSLVEVEPPSTSNIIDFYSGVGSIGLSVGANTLIESNEEAISFAEENILLNKIENCGTVLSPAEKTLEYIQKGATLIFDPPRAGLHNDVIDRILDVKPPKIIYLSCNIATQARDIGLLKEAYTIKSIKLYNLFPRTPHIEGLAILTLKKV